MLPQRNVRSADLDHRLWTPDDGGGAVRLGKPVEAEPNGGTGDAAVDHSLARRYVSPLRGTISQKNRHARRVAL